MRTAFQRPLSCVSVSSQAGLRLAGFRAGRAERVEKAEGKIKEIGTPLAGFLKLLLSAHWLGGLEPAPWFSARSAAIARKALVLLEFDRHYRRKSPRFRYFRPGARP